MRDYYTIGEVSKIMRISVQALRYYDSIDLLVPAYVNRRTGYRYYTEDQFHQIDRIKYLQTIGMSLSEIRDLFEKRDVDGLTQYLAAARKDTESKIRELTDLLETIEWHEQYFQDRAARQKREQPSHVQHCPARYLVGCEIPEGEEREDSLRRLKEKLGTEPFRQLRFCGQPEYVLDYTALTEDRQKATFVGVEIEGVPEMEDPDIRVIPEGEYFCFCARIQGQHWSAYPAALYFCDCKEQPVVAVAKELGGKRHEFSEMPYEIRVLIPDRAPN